MTSDRCVAAIDATMRTAAALTALAILSGACHLVGGPSFYEDADFYATAATGGGSGPTTSGPQAGPTSGVTTSTGDGAGGTPFACDTLPCEMTIAEPRCASARCDSDTTCTVDFDKPGTVCNDDLKYVCDGAGKCVECVDDTSCQDKAGRPLCEKASGFCAECLGPGDCALKGTKTSCYQRVCVEPFCANGMQNAETKESDVDCGGECSKCGTGKKCNSGTDCATGQCVGNVCNCTQQDQCPDQFYCNVSEGACKTKFGKGATCSEGFECQSGNCSYGWSCPPFSKCCQ